MVVMIGGIIGDDEPIDPRAESERVRFLRIRRAISQMRIPVAMRASVPRTTMTAMAQ